MSLRCHSAPHHSAWQNKLKVSGCLLGGLLVLFLLLDFAPRLLIKVGTEPETQHWEVRAANAGNLNSNHPTNEKPRV